MKELHTIEGVRSWLRPLRQAGRRIGFVPTMGALHEGHLSLIRAARAETQVVVVSIFVNPTQFGPHEDLDRYPRTLQADLEACRREGVDGVFVPSTAEMYRPDASTEVTETRLAAGLCGVHRPGHFKGVTTVVAKLFNIVQPDVACFGQKDAQQAAVIRRMVRDLDFPVEVLVCPTVREPDGLAMSSRNRLLSAEDRRRAVCLPQALRWAVGQVERGERRVESLVAGARERIAAAGPCEIDYVEIVDAEDLRPVATVSGRCLLAAAVRIGGVRLIDNMPLDAVCRPQ